MFIFHDILVLGFFTAMLPLTRFQKRTHPERTEREYETKEKRESKNERERERGMRDDFYVFDFQQSNLGLFTTPPSDSACEKQKRKRRHFKTIWKAVSILEQR